ncbi:tetratricopeptide repeat protein [Mucilaginibacter mali]|uniref:Tetratricopeptide repeat protein n=1 Tax=Mucilaginibacter mali TaxID=2740462 RepID=A0A7D4TL78_9SPHI|nr:tetratricopeptide repeat protein [Mucilaginibacter mali]QKJ29273.1 tetratricopeptide repeat protein [Mucilaginibacter mali]
MTRSLKLAIVFFLALTVQACRQSIGVGGDKYHTTPNADSLLIKSLIAKGQKLRNGVVDSLPAVAWELESVSKFRDNKNGIVQAGILKAYYYWLTADYATAMKVTLEALDNAQKWKLTEPVPELYSIMANIHKENTNYDAAFKDCINGLKIARLNKDTSWTISLLGLHAMFTHGYYRKTHQPQNDHTSLKMQFEALKMAESQPKYEKMRIRFYNNIGQAYKELGKYDSALVYARKAVVLANKYNQPRSLTYSYNWLGEAYYYMGQHEKGVAFMDSAITLSRKANLPYRQMEIYEAMHWCYLYTKNYEPAIAALKRSVEMHDSLQIASNEKQIAELQLKYNIKNKDKQIASLWATNKDTNRKALWILIGLLVFVLFTGIILYQYRVIKHNNKLMQVNNAKLNDALLRIAHIQSHQVRQPLASIMGLINVIKANNYKASKEVLQNMDTVANELDERIRAVIKEAEKGD